MLKDEIIQILKSECDFVSGSFLAEKFSVSRMTINFAIKELIKDRYKITALRNKGYKLEDSSAVYNLLELSNYLENVENIIFLSEVSSTNDYLKNLAKNGASEGTVVFADTQTAGKGRLGRTFFSPKGKGIYVSYLYKPNCSLTELTTLTSRVAVAVSKAIEKVSGIVVDIKWVNDLLLNEKKICGILTELSVIGEGMNPEFAVVGIGVNVNNRQSDFGSELKTKATSLFAETGREFSRIELLAEIIKNLRVLFDGDKAEDMEYYRNHCYNLGKKAVFEFNDDVVTGLVVGIDDDNGLVVQLGDEVITLTSGVVSIKTPNGYC